MEVDTPSHSSFSENLFENLHSVTSLTWTTMKCYNDPQRRHCYRNYNRFKYDLVLKKKFLSQIESMLSTAYYSLKIKKIYFPSFAL